MSNSHSPDRRNEDTAPCMHMDNRGVDNKEAQRDRELVAAVGAGDNEALGALYDRHGRQLLGVAIAVLGNERDAEDLLHDVFMELWQKADTYNPSRGPVIYWLILRTRSRAIDRQRSLRVKENFQAQAKVEAAASPQGAEIDWEQVEALECLSSLPARQRDVLVMNYIQGYTCQEISDMTQTPVGTVKSRLQSAIRRLRVHLAGEVA